MDCNNLVCITTSVKGIILVYLSLTYFIRVWVNVASSSTDSFRVRSFPLVIKLNTIKYCFLVSNLQWKIPTISGRLQYFTHTKSIGIFQQSLWEPGFIQKIATIFQGLFKDFSRTTLDFQGQPTRNIISQIVQKCIFPVYSNKTLRL